MSDLETRIRVACKFMRESDRVSAFWRFVQTSAQHHRSGDGFVEWSQVTSEVEALLERLGRER